MRKETIRYSSPLDALIEVTKRLVTHELEEKLSSEEFFYRYSHGDLSDDVRHVEWANDYRHYLSLRQQVEDQLRQTDKSVISARRPNIAAVLDELARHHRPGSGDL